MAATDVVVVGSANADLILSVDRTPRPGETVLALGDACRSAGGKGLNQAVAAARAGATTALVGAVGDDDDGRMLRAVLHGSTVDTARLRTADLPTGLAVVTVAADGENSIVVVAGANSGLTELTDADLEAVTRAHVLLGQLEIPVETFGVAAAAARSNGCMVLLNAAPARELPDSIWPLVDVLIVNEREAAEIAHGRDLLELVPAVVATLGAAGARYTSRNHDDIDVPALRARAVDTTGAGDTFCGVFAASLALDMPILPAMQRAAAAAAAAVERPGAVPSIPTRDEIEHRLREAGR